MAKKFTCPFLSLIFLQKVEKTQDVHENYAINTKYQIHEHYNFLHGKLQLEEDEQLNQLEAFKANLCAKTNEIKSVFDKVLADIQKKMHELSSFIPNLGNTQILPCAVFANECESLLKKVPEQISFDCETNPFE